MLSQNWQLLNPSPSLLSFYYIKSIDNIVYGWPLSIMVRVQYKQFWSAWIIFQTSHLQACCILWATLGFKKACKACLNYPALVLTPCFGTWTFGPAVKNNESTSKCFMSCESNKVRVSYKHTWINFGISFIGAIVTFFVGYENSHLKVSNFGTDVTRRHETVLVCISWVLIIVILPICIGFVQGVDKGCNCLCKCCPTKCFPVVERIELDVDQME